MSHQWNQCSIIPEGIRITNIVGEKIGNTFSFVLSGKVGHKLRVFLVYRNNVGDAPDLAVVASVEAFKLSDLLKDSVGVDIRKIPLLGSIRLPRIGLSVASDRIETSLLKTQIPSSSPLKIFARELLKIHCSHGHVTSRRDTQRHL